ncbi:MAG: hypothetical protein QM730_16820 [Anaerolineales bacterium]
MPIMAHLCKRSIIPNVIQRIIESNITEDRAVPTSEEIAKQVDVFVESQKDSVFDALSSYFHAQNRAGGVTDANKKAREKLEKYWATQEGRWSIVSGKIIISNLSGWSQKNFGVSFNPLRIIKNQINMRLI